MTGPSLLIIGSGDLGQRVSATLLQQHWRIGAVRRYPPESTGRIDWFAADYTVPGSLAFARDWQPDYVLASLTPAGRDPSGYRRGFADAADNLVQGLGDHRLQHLFMVSSTRVYAERDGGWVSEDSPLSTADERAVAIIEAERHLLQSGHPTTIVRCGGVYGAVPGRLVDKVARGQVAPAEPRRYTNRIHRDDAAGFLTHLLLACEAGQTPASVYNCVDDNPAPAHDVESWLADTLGISVKNGAGDAAAAPAFHKRCSNQRLRDSGYQLRYPDYRAGYSQVIEASR